MNNKFKKTGIIMLSTFIGIGFWYAANFLIPKLVNYNLNNYLINHKKEVVQEKDKLIGKSAYSDELTLNSMNLELKFTGNDENSIMKNEEEYALNESKEGLLEQNLKSKDKNLESIITINKNRVRLTDYLETYKINSRE
ncbi:hypothetical protein COY26_00820 [Candidatus Woesearchaeota archaeon CG_4_10_14_0_2_um_filter_33_10]|nr:MAG: hypothetical protein AUJ83_01480 [Candidatus Woesearchaeota archaeon CG1_02_33_12]PIN78671.1 MAG: hypothetical protein COV14_02535 [Candidatus Woesearchaeota archaeon CG10_big_fil_rev_8_21_14_0_10_33_12]PIU72628.1 MAG: hypothetical protein COS79_01955 [Candidatus Woesearchaeota archaeon CG06_land_8_20_14_3_00_33_13]PIZ53810.1 MAG: hypothetical protein COY26_00820 [Candidatus Woesearchaeota archaeon CG_4_10_14_0_2_um_filter_33_10]